MFTRTSYLRFCFYAITFETDISASDGKGSISYSKLYEATTKLKDFSLLFKSFTYLVKILLS